MIDSDLDVFLNALNKIQIPDGLTSRILDKLISAYELKGDESTGSHDPSPADRDA